MSLSFCFCFFVSLDMITYESLYSHHCFFRTSYRFAALIGESSTAVCSSITYTLFSLLSSSCTTLCLSRLRAAMLASRPR